jgi:hypothetical protein
MQEWLRHQEWGEELWVAAWVIAVVGVSIVLWAYGQFLNH